MKKGLQIKNHNKATKLRLFLDNNKQKIQNMLNNI